MPSSCWWRSRSGVRHVRFADLGDYLQAGDLLVVNNSLTLPAALDGLRAGEPITVHFSTACSKRTWVVELRPATNATGHLPDVHPGEQIQLPAGGVLTIEASYPQSGVEGARLWIARALVDSPGGTTAYLMRHGRPIRYSYVPRQWPLRLLPNGVRPSAGQC